MSYTITPDMTISEILSLFPGKSQRLSQAMSNAGLHCSNCSAATWETLESGMIGHGLNQAAIEKLVNELNAILLEEMNINTIALTERAAEKFKQFAEEEGLKSAGLRFGDQAGGCGGFQYLLDFCEHADSEDQIFESFGVNIFVKKKIVPRLMGCLIDYVDGLHGAGFKISNPNVKSSCGCGQSQGY
jgi:iron-sulfur cluster assembly protein